jgi:hypothetical protein
MLELLTEQTGTFYSVYYGDVKDEMSRLYSKYEQRYGEKRFEGLQFLVLLMQVRGSRHGEGSLEVLEHPLPPHLHLLHLVLMS